MENCVYDSVMYHIVCLLHVWIRFVIFYVFPLYFDNVFPYGSNLC